MKMRGTDNRYGSKRDLAEFEAKTMRSRELAHSREANFGSGRADGLSKMFGKLADEYAIYEACAPAPHKSFDEWLNS
jgi:hypothetical protein